MYEIENNILNISLSIGIALINANESADDILKHADIAMYEAKKAGRSTSRFYATMMDQWIARRLKIENALRYAIQNSELELHYQPIIAYKTNKIVGAEALLRWNPLIFDAVYPDEFIPIAEESGLILSIGTWVLENAIDQFMQWQKEFPNIDSLSKIAINLSAHQFNNPNFLVEIKNMIEEKGIDASCLELELVESIVVDNVEEVSNKMQKLRDLGMSISIDDFGTGYSSLSYLKKLPFTTLKIDRSFVMDLQDDRDDKELVSAILMIAQNFNFDVVSEGVETYEQYQFLNEKQCTYLQGYYCSKPLSVTDFSDLLQSSNGVCTKLS